MVARFFIVIAAETVTLDGWGVSLQRSAASVSVGGPLAEKLGARVGTLYRAAAGYSKTQERDFGTSV